MFQNKHLNFFLITQFFAFMQKYFLDIFINIYFWRISENIGILAMYNIIYYTTSTLFHLFACKIAKEKNRFLPIRIGLFFRLLFVFLFFLFQENIINHIFLIAVVGGVASGFYWATDNILRIDLTNGKNRLKSIVFIKISENIAQAIIPLIASFIIYGNNNDTSSYIYIFVVASFFTFVSFISSFFISDVKKFESKKFNLIKAGSGFVKNKNIRLFLFSTLLDNSSVALNILLGLLLFISTGTEISIGSYKFITFILAILVSYFFGKYIKRKHYGKILIYGGFLQFFVISILFFGQDFYLILLYGILSSLFSFSDMPAQPIKLDTISGYAESQRELVDVRVEYIVLADIFNNIGKILGFIILWLLSFSMNFYLIATVAAMLSTGRLFSNILVSKINNGKLVDIDGLN